MYDLNTVEGLRAYWYSFGRVRRFFMAEALRKEIILHRVPEDRLLLIKEAGILD